MSDASKLSALEERSLTASGVAGATGEPLFAATGIIANCRVRVVTVGYDHSSRRYEITRNGGETAIVETRKDALSFLQSGKIPWTHRGSRTA